MNMTITSNILLCALSILLLHGGVATAAAAAGNSGVDDTISARRLRNHRIRPHDEQPQGLIKRDDYGNKVEVAAPQQLRGKVDTPSQTTPPPFRPQQTKIVNGDIVKGENGDYPFQVQLGGWICGASLIAPDVVLTAAHCINGGGPSRVIIWDATATRPRMTPRTVESVVMHPKYKGLTNDIALIKLSEPALAVDADWDLVDNHDWVNHPPMIRLQRYQNPSGCTSLSQDQAEGITTMTVIGHGTIAAGGQMAGKLMEADVHYVLNSVCQKQYKNEDITDDMICASDTREEQDACQGDSGGPLFTRMSAAGGHDLFTLVGTVSWGYGCAMKEYPGVYSRVAANTDWIDEKVCEDLSPKSCTADGKIRDYALESLTGGTSVSRRTKKNVVTNNARAALYGEKLQEEVCELLGGSVDEKTLPPVPAPATSSPTKSSTPPPIVSPTMPPTPAPSSSPPSGSPSLPPGKSPTKKFITDDKNANQKAKGIMYQIKAEKGDVSIEKISFKTKDDMDTEVQVYFQLGSYKSFQGKGMVKNSWGPAVFNGIPDDTSGGLKEVVFDKALSIPKGGTASIHLVGKKEFMFEEGEKEFAVAADAGDFVMYTGQAMKKAFEQRLMNADFYGEITYRVATNTKGTPAPIFSPTMPPTPAPSSSPPSSKRPTSPPSKDGGGGGGGGVAKEYTTPGVNKAGDNAKGVMFQISAKSKVSITGLGIMGKDTKESDVLVYYQNGSYDEFDALDKRQWIEVFKGKVMLDRDELVSIELDEDIMMHAGGTVSLYVVSKKGVLFTKTSDKEFGIYAQSEDFDVQVGLSTKKEFQQPDKLAKFAGNIVYQT